MAKMKKRLCYIIHHSLSINIGRTIGFCFGSAIFVMSKYSGSNGHCIKSHRTLFGTLSVIGNKYRL